MAFSEGQGRVSTFKQKYQHAALVHDCISFFLASQQHFPESNRSHQASAGDAWIGPSCRPTAQLLRGKRS
eukprot:s1053_g12.t1